MPNNLYFGDLCFEPDLVSARTREKKKIRFSKHERALLSAFIRRPGSLLTRDHLLDAFGPDDLDTLDRNVDYMISRLRRKLGDSASHPRFIETQYGEGYLWIAKPQSPPIVDKQSIYLSVGPLFGLANLGAKKKDAESFAALLFTALKDSFGHNRRIERLPSEDSAADQSTLLAHQLARYGLELSFLHQRNEWVCLMVVLDRKTGQIFGTFRCNFSKSDALSPQIETFKQLADTIRDMVWGALIFRSTEQGSSSSEPLVIGLYEASKLFEPGIKNHQKVENKLRERLQQTPEDAHAAIMLAANLHTQILDGVIENPEEKLPEIEALIFDHLALIQNDPLYLAFAAEQLYLFGYRDLGKTMAQRALDIGPSFAACYMVIGRMHVTQGQFEEGLSYYDYCQGMTEKSSTFYNFLHTMKCIAYKAQSDHRRVAEFIPYLIDAEPDPVKKMVLRMFFASDDPRMDLDSIKQFVASLPLSTVRKALKLTHYGVIRAFCAETHRENLFRDAIKMILETHGQDAIPDVIQVSVPSLFATPQPHCANG